MSRKNLYIPKPERIARLTSFLLAFLVVLGNANAVFADSLSTAGSSASVTGTSAPVTNQTSEAPAPNSGNSQGYLSANTANSAATPSQSSGQNSNIKGSNQPHGISSDDEGGGGSIPTQILPENLTNLPNADKTNGSLNYSYPIQIPPGRNNFQPDLKLFYNSEQKIQNSAFGYGWQINIPYIELVNKVGSNFLYATSSSSTPYFTSSLWGDMVPSSTSSTSTYISKVDTGDFIKYTFANNQWTATDKQGDQYQFGYDASARQDNASSTSQVFKWMLEKEVDSNNNTITYSYYKDSGQIYPSTINYGGNATSTGIFTVTFSRESRTDAITAYNMAFPVKTNYLISEIQTSINSTNVGEWDLAYTSGDNGARSILQGVTQKGTDGGGTVTTLPQIKFTNQKVTTLNQNSSSLSLPTYANAGYTDFVDVNGDGLTDLVISYTVPIAGLTVQETYLNNGAGGWTLSSAYAPPEVFGYEGTGGDTDRTHYYMDVNGDGLNDLVVVEPAYGCGGGCSATYSVYLNTGDGWAYSSAWQVPFSVMTSNGGVTDNPAFMDVNGDGLPDIATSNSVYLNTGYGWSSTSTPWDWPESPVSTSPSVKFADINGDGIMDVLISDWGDYTSGGTGYSTSAIGAWLGDGNGNFVLSSGYTPPTLFEYDHENNGSCGCVENTGVNVYDYNGDGLPDLVQSTYGTTINSSTPSTGYIVQRVYLNTGTGWASPTSVSMNTYFTYTGESSQGDYALGDFNGDGITDTYDFESSTVGELPSYSAPADVINNITYPSGGDTTIQYKPSPQYLSSGSLLNPNLPEALQTVSQISTGDGLGNSTTTDSYIYSGGTFYYSSSTPLDRRLAGFNKITDTDAAGNVTNTYYHTGNGTDSSHGEYQDNYLKIGEPYRIEQYDNSGNLYQKTINKWDSATSTAATASSTAGFVFLNQSVVSDYSGGSSHKDKAESYSYDNTTGNQTQKIEYGQVTGSDDGTFTDTGTDDFTTNISYASSSGNSIIGDPSDIVVTNHGGSKVKETQYYYDGQSLGVMGSYGNQTKEMDWKTGSTYVTPVQKTYNTTYGIVTQSKDGNNNATNYSYDSYNLYPTTVTNALSQATGYSYNYLNGKVATTTDPNGNIFATSYDGFGRPLVISQPDQTSTSTQDTKIAYTYTDTSGAVSVHEADYMSSTSTIDTYTYYDGLNRPIQTRKSVDGTNYETKDIVYDNRGQVEKQSLPYFSSGSSKTSPTATATLYDTYTYDPLNRVLTSVNAVGTTSNSYTPWETTTTDPRSKIKNLSYDAYGNLAEVDEHNASSVYSTYYTYDYLKDLTGITDALGNVRNFTYDGLGNRLTAQDLHASGDSTYGSWSYTYDNANNLTQVQDPNSNTINYGYDALNRKSTESLGSAVKVAYTYDTCANGIGRLCQASSSALTILNAYDPEGDITVSTSTIATTSYPTLYSYDRQGNQTLITNPDSSLVQYTYNPAGLIASISEKEPGASSTWSSIINSFTYSPTEQPAIISYGNNATTTNTYDASNLYRLSSKISTASTGSGSSTVQSLAYTYDADGNITQTVDNSSTDTKKTVNYIYDDLNRLTSASSTLAAAGGNYLQTYTYDALGNITNKSDQGSYSYNGSSGSNYANPDAVTSIGSLNYSYDHNGNLTSVGIGTTTPTSYTWDYNNRLTQSIASSTTSTYTYDPNGERVSYNNGSTTTYYPTKEYNINNSGNITKHIFANGIMVATLTSVPTPTHGGTCTVPTSGDWTITSSCTLTGTAIAPQSVIVNAGVELTIATSSKLLIDLKHYKLLVHHTGGVLVKHTATLRQVKPSDTGAQIYYQLTDNLTGQNISLDSSGNVTELTDYYPYGSIRLDEQSGFNNPRKFAGTYFDSSTGLNYLNSRYLNTPNGKFLSEDPVFLAMGDQGQIKQLTSQQLQQYLANPQSLNAYGYALDNPIINTDPNGLYPSWFLSAGNAINNNSLFNYAVSHPLQGGLMAAIGSAVALTGVSELFSAGYTGLGIGVNSASTAASIGTTACAAECDKVAQTGSSEYNAAVDWVTSRYGTNAAIPSESEIQSVSKYWANTNFDSQAQAILYHVNEHADGASLEELTQNGQNVWNSYISNSSAVKNVIQNTLQNGESGLKINLTSGAGGIFTNSGGIVSTWFK